MGYFEEILPIVLKEEGGLAMIQGDPGGTTNRGISQRMWSVLRKSPVYTGYPISVAELTPEQTFHIYQREYWNPKFDEVPKGVALVLFDCAVNQGQGTAVKVLQRTLKVGVDGKWGPETDRGVRLANRDVPRFIDNLCWERLQEYAKDSKAQGKASQFPWFLVSLWVPRLSTIRDTAMRMP